MKDGLIGGGRKDDGISGGGQKLPYESPAIIYEGELTTRAGSKIPGGELDYDVDPEKLFGGLG